MQNTFLITDLKTEYETRPMGLDERSPRFSWKIVSDEYGFLQQSYRIIVAGNGETVWGRYPGKHHHGRKLEILVGRPDQVRQSV